MSKSHDDPIDAPSAVSAALTEQMLHLSNRFHEECRKLEERTFRPEAEEAHEGDEG